MKLTTKCLILIFTLSLYVECRRALLKRQEKEKEVSNTTIDKEIEVNKDYIDKIFQLAKENKMFDEISGILSTIVEGDEASIKKEVNEVFANHETCSKEYLEHYYKSGNSDLKGSKNAIKVLLNKLKGNLTEKKK